MSESTVKPIHLEEKRVSTLAGNRLCTKCGYNLIGQSVVREPHYDMLMVRCSECGSVASIQEYPLLGRWAVRWAMLIAALWFALSTLFLLATSGMLYGFGNSITTIAIYPYAKSIAELQVEWYEAQDTQTQQQQMFQYQISQGAYPYINIDQTWWSTQDPQALLTSSGGWSKVGQWPSASIWIPLSLYVFLAGCFWAVLLTHLRRFWLILFCFLPIGLSAVFGAMYYSSDNYLLANWGWFTAQDIANDQLGMIFFNIANALMLIPLLMGIIFGRSIVRLLIRMLLPHRLRNSLAILWISDGLEPPCGKISS